MKFEETNTRPVGRCLTSVYLQYWQGSLGTHSRHGRPVCSAAPSSQAPTPHSGAPKARGLTAKARTERSSMLPRCASLSDTVREIEYRFLQVISGPDRLGLRPGLVGNLVVDVLGAVGGGCSAPQHPCYLSQVERRLPSLLNVLSLSFRMLR
jgi:hypothetical protein